MGLPLNGIRVLDISRGIAASYCTFIMAEYGAEVIKVESSLGDIIRFNPPVYNGTGTSFISINRNKKSIQLDLDFEEQRKQFLELVPTADVIVENFRPGVMERLGITYDCLKGINERVVLCSVSAFGQRGEWSKRASHDNNLIGLSGLLRNISPADGTSTKPVPLLAGIVGGSMWALIGILLALGERKTTGRGQHVDIAILHGLQSLMIPEIIAQLATGDEQIPGKTWNTGLLPSYNIYETSDGHWITFGAVEPKFWKNYCEVIDRKDLENDFYPHGDNPEKITQEITKIFASYTREEIIALSNKKEMMLDPILTLEESLQLPPVIERRSLFKITDGEGTEYPQMKLPLFFNDKCPENLHPSMGEHNSIYLDNAEKTEKTILIVYHSQGGTMKSMAEACKRGAVKVDNVRVVLKSAGETTLNDLVSCDGLAIGSPEYFGYMAGAIKDLFDRTYEKAREKTFRLPFVLFVCAGNDGRGAVTQIEKIATGYQWKKVQEPLRITGSPKDTDLRKIEELGQTLAAGVEAGIY